MRRSTFVPVSMARKKGKRLVDGRSTAPDAHLVVALARAVYWHELLDAGVFRSVAELAQAEGLKPTTVGRMLRLARLAPDLVEQCLACEQPRRLTLLWLMRHDIPISWPAQRQLFDQFREGR